MNETKDAFKVTTFDRASFIVGLSAALLALFPFKDDIQININLFGFSLSLYTTALIFLGLLLLSAYLYGINNIRYSIPRVLEWEWTRFIESAALIIYTIAFLFPVALFTLWPISKLINIVLSQKQILLEIVLNSSTFIAGISTAYAGYLVSKNRKDSVVAELSELGRLSRIEIGRAYEYGDFRVSLLSLYQGLMTVLKVNLVSRVGIRAKSLPDSQIIRIASDLKIFNENERVLINDLRGIRNKITHGVDGTHITKEAVRNLRDRISPIIKRLSYQERG
ncbi:MAG: hypothetical protein K9M11_02540 [Candidatus Pacebacteria bacterium]|nr:hypothetical protein [Candidatus Paceibacterota bacterium]